MLLMLLLWLRLSLFVFVPMMWILLLVCFADIDVAAVVDAAVVVAFGVAVVR